MKTQTRLILYKLLFTCCILASSGAVAFTNVLMMKKRASPSPTFVQAVQTTWNTNSSPRTTSSFNVLAGDILVAYSGKENGAGCTTTISGGSLTWTLRQSVDIDGDRVDSFIWTAVVDVDKSMTTTFTCAGGAQHFGGAVLTFRNSSGVGASSKIHSDTDAAPSLNITTTQANSAIVVLNGDWNARDGASRVWRTGAGAFSEITYDGAVLSTYIVYGGYHANAGVAGSKTVGLTTPSDQKYGIVAVEIKGP